MSSLFAAWTLLGFACSVEDENPATTRARGTDSGSDGNVGTGEDGSVAVDPAVCGKLGGAEGVKVLASQIINLAKNDCRIGPIFADAEQNGGAHFNECFQIFLAGGVRCPGVTYEDGKTVDSKGDKCNRILPGLELSAMDYKAFADFNVKNPQSVVTTLMDSKGLTADDLRGIGALFEGKKASLLAGSDVPNDKYTQCAPNCAPGGEACIPLIIDGGADTGPKDTGAPQDAANDG